MTDGVRQTSSDSRYAVWIGATIALFLAAVVIGFIVLPSAQEGADDLSLWGVICRGIGLRSGITQIAESPITTQPSSAVAWTVATRGLLISGDAVRGAAHSTTCNNCHGANGVSADAAIPNLAGQSVAAIYKQLVDFKDGKRNAAVMGVFVNSLSQAELLDLAAYYASLRNPISGAMKTPDADYPGARHLIEYGNPIRSIASCTACHGPLGLTPGAPGLQGQQRAYLELQMQEFKGGARHNDIGEQMRSVARQLTQDEIAMLAAYYASLADLTTGR
jgi:cytochrome c553